MSFTAPGPVPPYSNPPIQPQNYKPSVFEIADITLGQTTLVTTELVHNYVIGQMIRLLIPPTYRSRQFNEKQAYVVSIPSPDEVVIDIDSRFFDEFDPNPSYSNTPPQIVAIGDINTPSANASGRVGLQTTIPGAFQNISPQPEE